MLESQEDKENINSDEYKEDINMMVNNMKEMRIVDGKLAASHFIQQYRNIEFISCERLI
jgi:hypothetical protein